VNNDSDSDDNTQDDTDLFRRMMTDVRPLPADNRTPAAIPRKTVHRQRTSATAEAAETGFTPREYALRVASEESLFFARSGLQQRLLRRLKRGDISPQATLDLHSRSVAEAGEELAAFLLAAQKTALRCVIVIHGKGYQSIDGKPVLKIQVNHWLRDAPSVLAFSSAQLRHGGMGAVYVLLRRPKL
jgi:DNA-nicking Smr family endonuclease